MRVLAITNLFPNVREPNRGVFNLQQLEALKEHGEVRVIAPVPWQPWAYGLYRPAPYDAVWNGIQATYPFYFFTPRVGRVAYAFWMYESIRGTVKRVIREFRPDVILGTWAYPDAVAVAALAGRAGIPWVAKVHGSDINQYSAAPSLRAQIRRALRQASCTFAVSRPLKERLVEIGVPAEKVRVQHNGINVQRFRPLDKLMARQRTGLARDRRVVVYVGNLKVSKGAADLVEAARCMTGGSEAAPLVALVGDGPARGLLEETIARHSLGEHVRLIGARPHDEIPDWIAAADTLCLPSHQEGCPNVVLEALACGRPVVASRVGAVPEFVDESCGAVVSPQEPEQLAAALKTVVAREWDPAALRERVLPLSWEENARVLAGELERAIRERKSPVATAVSRRQDGQIAET